MGANDFVLPFQQRLLDQVEMALEEIKAGGNSQGILLIGASGTGKSHGLDLVANRYAFEQMDGYQRITPCCRVSASTKADAYTTVAGVLTQLGKPMPNAKGNSNLMTLELSMQAALVAHRVQILIFEEFHNALLSGTPQLRGQTARLLKNQWNQSPLETAIGWAVPDIQRGDHRLVNVISGTDELREVFDKDKELGSRFGCVVEASSLNFSPPDSFKDFRYVFRSMAERFGLSDRLDADDDAIVARFLAACEAHLRVLEKLMQRTATLSRRQGVLVITLELLATAFDQIGGTTHPMGNPFRWTDEELTAHIVRSQAKAVMNKSARPRSG